MKAAIIGITESKRDHTEPNSEVNLPGYNIFQCDRNGGGVACTITQHCKEIDFFFFDILLPKSKPVPIGVFFRYPNPANFMGLTVEKLSNINLEDNKIYLRGDFNSNLFQNDNYMHNAKKILPLKDQSILWSIGIRNFVEFTL